MVTLLIDGDMVKMPNQQLKLKTNNLTQVMTLNY